MTEHAWIEAHFAEIRPKAIAALNRQFRDLDLAEELFASSCLKALQSWPGKGLPDDPFAWLLTVARNAGRDTLRRQKPADVLAAAPAATETPETGYIERLDERGLRDDVLRLLFVCCHPALSPQDQSALALRIVAGLSVDEIARAFLVKPKAMEQRITRAKKTIGRANIPFEPPTLTERHDRLKSVTLMIYLLFNEGWSASSGEVHIKAPLCDEAIRLVRLLLTLFPSISELMGLLALFLLQHARAKARLKPNGDVILLDDQDRSLWDGAMIAEGKALLEKALRHGTPGPYQIQAAIAAVHADAKTSQDTDWQELAQLYGALYRYEPTPVVKLNQAAAVAQVRGPQAALDMLDPLAEQLADYRWYHATRAGLLEDLHLFGDARAAYCKALSLGPTHAEKRFLADKIAACEKNL